MYTCLEGEEDSEKPNPDQVVRPGSTTPKVRVKKGGRSLNIPGSSAESKLAEEALKLSAGERSRANAKERDHQPFRAIKHAENYPKGPIANKEEENKEEVDDMPF